MANMPFGAPFELSLGARAAGSNNLNPLEQHLLSGWLDELTSRPGPSDRLNSDHRQAAANQPANGDYSTVLPQSQQPINNTPWLNSPLNFPRQVGAQAPIQIGQPAQGFPSQSPFPVLHGDPGRRAPAYPGGIGPDANVTGRLISTVGPGPNALYQIFLRTYNDRSNENVLPSSLPLREIAPEVQGQVQRWMLLTDSDMSQKFSQFHGRDLRPQPATNPGRVYAIGLNAGGNPVDVLDFYWNQNNMTYFGQHVINYFKDNRGNLHTHISNYTANYETTYPGPQRIIGDSQNVYTGASEYVDAPDGTPLAMVHYSNLDSRNPALGFNFNPNGATMFWSDTNSGQRRQQNLNMDQAKQAIISQSQQFDFEHLYGPVQGS
ncbi:MAG TPA: hypothetical protein V6C72_05750 [Chroococcales cyanobacterium]